MLWETILLALREIRRSVLRSSLTILGIVIGVAAVITMVTLGKGATAKVTSDISKLGSNLLQVRPGQGFGRGGMRSTAVLFKVDDAVAIDREISGLATGRIHRHPGHLWKSKLVNYGHRNHQRLSADPGLDA
jgi:putative ABC transport system permease protein